MTTGERIKEARKKRGFTQKELGILSGTSEITIRQYEIGKRQPRTEQLHRIADALGVSVSSFLDENEMTIDFAMQITQALALIKSLYEQEEVPVAVKKLIEKQGLDIEFLMSQLATVTLKSYHPSEIDKIRNQLNSEGWKRVLEFAEEMAQIPKYQKSHPPLADEK